jgi:hypothetical protein
MDEKDLKIAQDKLAADQAAFTEGAAALATKEAAFDTKQSEFAEAQRVDTRKALGKYTEGLAKNGKIPAAKAPELADFMSHIPDSVELEFGEGDKKTKQPMNAWLREFLDGMPVTKPDTGILSPEDNDDDKGLGLGAAADLSTKAVAYQEKQRQAGIDINIVAAVQAVQDGKAG